MISKTIAAVLAVAVTVSVGTAYGVSESSTVPITDVLEEKLMYLEEQLLKRISSGDAMLNSRITQTDSEVLELKDDIRITRGEMHVNYQYIIDSVQEVDNKTSTKDAQIIKFLEELVSELEEEKVIINYDDRNFYDKLDAIKDTGK